MFVSDRTRLDAAISYAGAHHVGRSSSHFTRRLRQVRQPVFTFRCVCLVEALVVGGRGPIDGLASPQ